MAFKRADRVGPLIFEEISRELVYKLEDPRLKGVSFTKVEMTADLKIARVYFSMSGDEQMVAGARKSLDKAAGKFKKAIGSNLDLRYMPDLEFYYDKNLDHAQKIEKIIKEIHENEPGPDEESG